MYDDHDHDQEPNNKMEADRKLLFEGLLLDLISSGNICDQKQQFRLSNDSNDSLSFLSLKLDESIYLFAWRMHSGRRMNSGGSIIVEPPPPLEQSERERAIAYSMKHYVIHLNISLASNPLCPPPSL